MTDTIHSTGQDADVLEEEEVEGTAKECRIRNLENSISTYATELIVLNNEKSMVSFLTAKYDSRIFINRL